MSDECDGGFCQSVQAGRIRSDQDRKIIRESAKRGTVADHAAGENGQSACRRDAQALPPVQTEHMHSMSFAMPDRLWRAHTRSLRLTCINGDRTALRSLQFKSLFLAAPQRRGVSGTLARSPMRFAAAALSFSRWRLV
jgi:hypothetical protein